MHLSLWAKVKKRAACAAAFDWVAYKATACYAIGGFAWRQGFLRIETVASAAQYLLHAEQIGTHKKG
jgi:hypothetical protein